MFLPSFKISFKLNPCNWLLWYKNRVLNLFSDWACETLEFFLYFPFLYDFTPPVLVNKWIFKFWVKAIVLKKQFLKNYVFLALSQYLLNYRKRVVLSFYLSHEISVTYLNRSSNFFGLNWELLQKFGTDYRSCSFLFWMWKDWKSSLDHKCQSALFAY